MDLSRTPAPSTTERGYEAGSGGGLSLCASLWVSLEFDGGFHHYPGGAPGRAVAKHLGVAGYKPRDSEDAKTRSCLPALTRLVLLSKGRGRGNHSPPPACTLWELETDQEIFSSFSTKDGFPLGPLNGIKSLLIAGTSGLRYGLSQRPGWGT